MALSAQQELERQYVMETYGRLPVQFVRGAGIQLFDVDGNQYLDFIAGIGSVSVGHCHPKVSEAIREQSEKLVQVSNFYYVEGRGELAEELSGLLNYGFDAAPDGVAQREVWKTFFANSGTEALECAIKLARRYGAQTLDGAGTIVCAKSSFHGRSFGALSATGQPSKQDVFAPLLPGFIHVELNDSAALQAALDVETEAGKVVAVLLEPIQGEGGVWPCSPEYLQAARALTAERGMLLMLDEVQTGFCRTGEVFAFQGYGVIPDVVCMAKGMASGMPIGAVAACGVAATSLQPGDHGSTFGGNPLALAAARATIQVLREMDAAKRAAYVGAYLQERLAELPGIVQLRGQGLMLAAQLEQPLAREVVMAALARGQKSGFGLVLNATSSDTLRFLPPLCCSTEDVATMMIGFGAVIQTL